MHLVWIGACKKVMSAHIEGKFGFRTYKLNGRKLNILDTRMVTLQSFCPSEFNRRPQEISKFAKFKATECRQFLLYAAPAVLKDIFLDDHYLHFMILHSVMRLLVRKSTPRDMHSFCQEALETFVEICVQLYGEQFLSYNIHGLLHIVEDVMELGSAETYSAFCFENSMSELRKYIRKPGMKLQQVYKRISEKEDFTPEPSNSNNGICLSQKHAEGPVPENIPVHLCKQFKNLKFEGFTFAIALRDSCCLLKNSKLCLIRNIILIEGIVTFILQEFESKRTIYDVGVTSDLVDVYECTNLMHELQAVPFTDVKSKVYLMPKWNNVEGLEEVVLENQYICASLLSPLEVPDNIDIHY